MSLDSVNNIVLILSGKGGVGKSSITTQLALALTLRGHSVGILDVDLTGPSMPRFLNIEDAKITQAPGGWLPVEVHGAQTLPPAPAQTFPQPASENGHDDHHGPETNHSDHSNHNDPVDHQFTSHPPNGTQNSITSTSIGPLHAMSLGLLLSSRSSSIVWRGPKKTAMVRQFLTDIRWPPLDYLLVDTPPGTSDEHISLAESLLQTVTEARSTGKSHPTLAGAVMVTTPQAVAISDVRKELNFCAKTGVKVIGVVENMSGFVCPCCGVATNVFSKGGGRSMAREFGVPFLGEVPVDGLWGELVEEGTRPVYTAVAVAETDDVDDESADGLGEIGWDTGMGERSEDPRKKEPGLLVEKYRSCSLCPVFERIAGEVHDTVEKGTAVELGNG